MLRKPLLTTHEVAALLKVKEATVRRWIRNRELPALLIGREWRIAAIQLEEFLALRATAILPDSNASTDPHEPASDPGPRRGQHVKAKREPRKEGTDKKR